MNKIITLTLLLLCGGWIFGQSQSSFVVQKWDIDSPDIESIAFVRFDSTRISQSTVLEYKDFVVLLDLPAITSSLKSVLVSHWHAHSISGIIPFLEKGIGFYITPHNWHKALRDGVLPMDYPKADNDEHIRFIDKDTVLLSESNFPMRCYTWTLFNIQEKPQRIIWCATLPASAGDYEVAMYYDALLKAMSNELKTN